MKKPPFIPINSPRKNISCKGLTPISPPIYLLIYAKL